MVMLIVKLVLAGFHLPSSPMQNKTALIPQGSIQPGGVPRPSWKQAALASAAALAMMGVSLDAQALALGAITVRSALGEPLRAEIEVPQISSEEATSFQASLGSQQAFRAAGVDYSPALAGARVTLHRRANGEAYLRLVGNRPVNEPFVGVVIEANWANGRIVRDYTMLVDPPGRGAPRPVTVTQSQVSPSVATPLPAPPAQRRAAPASTPALAPAGGGSEQVTVQRGDTASRLASAYAVEGVSLDQMLVAMLRANPNAFIRGNVNLLKAGAVLQVPTAEEAQAVSPPAAHRAVLAQSRDFQAYRGGLAQRVRAAEVASAGRSASGSVQPQVQDGRAPAPSQDRLTLSRDGSAPSDTESTLARSRQAQEQAERVAELNKNISELSRLQSAPAAATASGAGPSINASVAAVTTTPTVPAPAASEAAGPTPEVASTASEAASDAAPGLMAASAPAAADSAAEAAAPVASVPGRPQVAAPAPAPMAESSFLDSLMENPLVPVAGVGLLALLAGYGVYRSRQKKKEAAPLDSSFLESQLRPDSFFDASGGQRVNTKDGGGTVGGSSSMTYSPSQLDTAGDVDPVAEADVYLAYGRDMQAEEILKEALRVHPGRTSIHRKLTEIYAKRRDARALEAIATEAHGVTQGNGPDWQAIASLGSELEPDNPLYKRGRMPVPKAAPTSGAQPTFGADTESETAQLAEKLRARGHELPDLDLDNAPLRATPAAPGPSQRLGAALAAAVAARTAATSAPVKPPAPDLDLDLDFAPPSELSATPTPASDWNMIEFDMDALSLDLDLPSGGDLETELPDDANSDPLATKLSLAKDLRAIGDTEGASTLVKEVIAEASGALKARAERFLAEL